MGQAGGIARGLYREDHRGKEERMSFEMEDRLAHLERTVEELNVVVTRQQGEIDVLTRRVQMLMKREAEREADGGGGVILGDERPPHY